MPSAHEDEVYLHNLPSDIVRKIVGMDRASVHGMRMVSHRWNNLVAENLSEGKNLPTIDTIRWYNLGNVAHLKFSVKSEYLTYFGLGKFNCITETFAESKKLEMQKDFGKSKLPELSRLFNRCSKIERVQLEVDHTEDVNDIKILTKVLRDVKIEAFALAGPLKFEKCICIKSASLLLDFIRAKMFDRLILCLAIVSPMDLNELTYPTLEMSNRGVKFIMAALLIVKEVRIEWPCYDGETSDFRSLAQDINQLGKLSAVVDVVTRSPEDVVVYFTLAFAKA